MAGRAVHEEVVLAFGTCKRGIRHVLFAVGTLNGGVTLGALLIEHGGPDRGPTQIGAVQHRTIEIVGNTSGGHGRRHRAAGTLEVPGLSLGRTSTAVIA